MIDGDARRSEELSLDIAQRFYPGVPSHISIRVKIHVAIDDELRRVALLGEDVPHSEQGLIGAVSSGSKVLHVPVWIRLGKPIREGLLVHDPIALRPAAAHEEDLRQGARGGVASRRAPTVAPEGHGDVARFHRAKNPGSIAPAEKGIKLCPALLRVRPEVLVDPGRHRTEAKPPHRVLHAHEHECRRCEEKTHLRRHVTHAVKRPPLPSLPTVAGLMHPSIARRGVERSRIPLARGRSVFSLLPCTPGRSVPWAGGPETREVCEGLLDPARLRGSHQYD